jgi:hypothetical protein
VEAGGGWRRVEGRRVEEEGGGRRKEEGKQGRTYRFDDQLVLVPLAVLLSPPFRNCRFVYENEKSQTKRGRGGQKPEAGGQRPEARGQRPETRGHMRREEGRWKRKGIHTLKHLKQSTSNLLTDQKLDNWRAVEPNCMLLGRRKGEKGKREKGKGRQRKEGKGKDYRYNLQIF